jgi:hypothetical protein
MIEQLQLRNSSETTIHTYVAAVSRFAKRFGKSPDQLGPEQVRGYLLHLLNDKRDSWTTIQVNRADQHNRIEPGSDHPHSEPHA